MGQGRSVTPSTQTGFGALCDHVSAAFSLSGWMMDPWPAGWRRCIQLAAVHLYAVPRSAGASLSEQVLCTILITNPCCSACHLHTFDLDQLMTGLVAKAHVGVELCSADCSPVSVTLQACKHYLKYHDRWSLPAIFLFDWTVKLKCPCSLFWLVM